MEKKFGKIDSSIKYIVMLIVGAVIGQLIIAGYDLYKDNKADNQYVDQKLNTLFSAIVATDGLVGEQKVVIGDSRIKKLKMIRDIQKEKHPKIFSNIEKILPQITDKSSSGDWRNVLNAHENLEKKAHPNFSVAQASAFWKVFFVIAANYRRNFYDNAKTLSQSPASILFMSEELGEFDIKKYSNENIKGVWINKNPYQYLPSKYPVHYSEDNKSIFVPSFQSLSDLNVFKTKQRGDGGAGQLKEKKKGRM